LAKAAAGSAVDLADIPAALREADLVVSCTGAREVMVSTDVVAAAAAGRTAATPLVFVDLALPHDIDVAVRDLPGVVLIRLADLADQSGQASDADVRAVEHIVAEEATAFAAARSAAAVAPTLVALRTMATGIVAAELERLWGRLGDGDISAQQRAEIAATVRRVADKLLHEPTVRVKRLADQAPSPSYADALAELFALDSGTVFAVTGETEEP
jgi:glutamyl-tRNA reductase